MTAGKATDDDVARFAAAAWLAGMSLSDTRKRIMEDFGIDAPMEKLQALKTGFDAFTDQVELIL